MAGLPKPPFYPSRRITRTREGLLEPEQYNRYPLRTIPERDYLNPDGITNTLRCYTWAGLLESLSDYPSSVVETLEVVLEIFDDYRRRIIRTGDEFLLGYTAHSLRTPKTFEVLPLSFFWNCVERYDLHLVLPLPRQYYLLRIISVSKEWTKPCGLS